MFKTLALVMTVAAVLARSAGDAAASSVQPSKKLNTAEVSSTATRLQAQRLYERTRNDSSIVDVTKRKTSRVEAANPWDGSMFVWMGGRKRGTGREITYKDCMDRISKGCELCCVFLPFKQQ